MDATEDIHQELGTTSRIKVSSPDGYMVQPTIACHTPSLLVIITLPENTSHAVNPNPHQDAKLTVLANTAPSHTPTINGTHNQFTASHLKSLKFKLKT
jgi:hypothetical protein